MILRLVLLSGTVVGVVLIVVFAAGGSENPYVVGAGATLALGTAVAQFFDYGPYVRRFTENDWKPGVLDGSDMWFIDIPYRAHGRRSPVPTVWVPLPDGGFEEVDTSAHTIGRTVRVIISRDNMIERRFSGEVRIH